MTTTFRTIEISLLEVHKNNPRRRAVADPELVESIRSAGILQPLVVAPIPDPRVAKPQPGMGVTLQRYVVLAGHRRLSGAKKAKLKQVPCVVREDLATEGQQVEAMLIENAHRQDLTPIEEAEGFAQLQLFGYKQKDIAKATGRDPKTVSSRLKLLKLAKSTKDRVHKGQMTLDDALVITEFADDPDTTKRLEKAAGDGYQFKYAVQRARAIRKENAETAATAAELRQRDVPEFTDTPPAGALELWETGLRDPESHDGCLTFAVRPATEYSGERIQYACTAGRGGHAEQLDAAAAERQRATEEARQAREAKEAADAAAEKVRAATIMDTVGLAGAMSAPLRDLIRALLPQLVARLHGISTTVYQDAINIHPDDRWTDNWDAPAKRRRQLLIGQHAGELMTASDNVLARALVAVLLATAEANLQGQHERDTTLASRCLELLEQLGHEFCDVDEQLRTDVAGAPEERAS